MTDRVSDTRPTARDCMAFLCMNDGTRPLAYLAEHGYAVVSVAPDDLERAVDVACGEGYKYADTNRQRCQAAIHAALRVLGVEVSDGTE